MLTLAWLGHGTVARLRGEPIEAARRFTDALDVATRAGTVPPAVTALTGLAAAQLDGGDDQAAAQSLARATATAMAGAVTEAAVTAALLEQRARLAFVRGPPDERTALLADATVLRDAASRPRTALEARDAAAMEVPATRC